MVRCQICGEEVQLPFVCSYCKGSFCVVHRLPESHGCPNLYAARPPIETQRVSADIPEYKAVSTRQKPLLSREVKHLLLAWLVIGFCFSLRALFNPSQYSFPVMFGIALLAVGSGFICHELSHRHVARRYGFHAEFRLWRWGLIMALVVALLSQGSFIFAAPGAVYIIPRYMGRGYGISLRENGIISAAGALANLAIGFAFLSVAGLSAGVSGLLQFIGLYGALINFFLAAFNMIPFGMLDGSKVFAWNKTVWAVIAVPAWIGTVWMLTTVF